MNKDEVSLTEWLNSINQSKNNIMIDDPKAEALYTPFVINKCMSGHLDTILLANQMNMNSHLDKKMQYDFLLNTVRSRKRFSPWLKKTNDSRLKCIQKYYGFSESKAKEALSILNEDQIKVIENKMNTGGKA